MKTVVSLAVNFTQERMCCLLCVCGNDIFSTAHNTSQMQGCNTNNATTCCLWGPHGKAFGKDQRHICPCLLLSLAMILLHKSGKLVELLDSCSKDYWLRFFICISRKNFLEGYTTTHAYTKINCLYRNLWMNVQVTLGTMVMYLRIHLELLTLNHNRVADFRIVISVRK